MAPIVLRSAADRGTGDLVAAFATGKNLVDEAAARASVSEVVGD